MGGNNNSTENIVQ